MAYYESSKREFWKIELVFYHGEYYNNVLSYSSVHFYTSKHIKNCFVLELLQYMYTHPKSLSPSPLYKERYTKTCLLELHAVITDCTLRQSSHLYTWTHICLLHRKTGLSSKII